MGTNQHRTPRRACAGGHVEVVVPEMAEGQVVKVSVSMDNAMPSLEEFFAACGNVDIDEAAVERLRQVGKI